MVDEIPSEPDHDQSSVQYARRLYDRVLAWYESAERKAQLILTLDGLFLSFLTGSLLAKPTDLRPIIERFGIETWSFFSAMVAALVLSIASAVLCSISRLDSRASLQRHYSEFRVSLDDPSTYGPEVLWFFQHVAGLNPEALQARMRDVASPSEVDALAHNVVPLARNVVAKHRLANLGFLFAGLVLVLFLATGVSYAIRVA